MEYKRANDLSLFGDEIIRVNGSSLAKVKVEGLKVVGDYVVVNDEFAFKKEGTKGFKTDGTRGYDIEKSEDKYKQAPHNYYTYVTDVRVAVTLASNYCLEQIAKINKKIVDDLNTIEKYSKVLKELGTMNILE